MGELVSIAICPLNTPSKPTVYGQQWVWEEKKKKTDVWFHFKDFLETVSAFFIISRLCWGEN